ncbi:MSMEG_4193 family putative phosphomutase [Bogoriella caseilytica]|uniref:Putative phosphomutase (TIGR03848 family) n=1 Tax=Bogoriella caseilytica TaxID=56055 RepID=A0A3N2BFA0_9MICO|nr:MSMEG_4193 family putative phosphomutase [Bogoriella caseilytica]ROR73939.1 putative phosphomutase (TIGR03848 family) [Bogoriella caseilytica]
MATLILIRHGRSTANTAGVLAGRSAGISLDDTGRRQAEEAGTRLQRLTLARLVSSPLLRCQQTAQAVAAYQREDLPRLEEDGLTEGDYGQWQGRSLKDLTAEPLWSQVQRQPSAVTFPGGESLRAMQARAVEAVRRHDAEVEATHGPKAVWALVSHGDIIASTLAEACGMHLDHYQRLQVFPGSVSIVRYTPERPAVLALNTAGGDLTWLEAPTPGTQPGGSAP